MNQPSENQQQNPNINITMQQMFNQMMLYQQKFFSDLQNKQNTFYNFPNQPPQIPINPSYFPNSDNNANQFYSYNPLNYSNTIPNSSSDNLPKISKDSTNIINYKWSLTRNSSHIPYHILNEYDNLIKDHLSKKRIENNFFNQQKATDYKTYFNHVLIPEQYEKSTSFQDSEIENDLKDNLKLCNFTSMTAIQQTTIPLALNKKDIMACSQTGSGKTLAFLLPVISELIRKYKLNELKISEWTSKIISPFILILSPTRELAEQINNEARKTIYKIGLHSVAVYGGVKSFDQSKKFYNGCEILIATPGRLIDMLKNSKVSLNNVMYFILDEADEMLNMGFLPQIKEIIYKFDLPNKENRQNLLFSATFEKEIQDLASSFMNEYYFVTNKEHNLDMIDNQFQKNSFQGNTQKSRSAKENIEQILSFSKDIEEKIYIVSKFFKEKDMSAAIIFVDKKEKVDYIKNKLLNIGFPCTSIHGNKPQNQRQQAIDEFRKGKYKAIVATNILARGLDFVDVDCVVNFDMPTNIEDYIHRIGRAGRLGGKGYALSFIEKDEKFRKMTKDLIDYLVICKSECPEWLKNIYNSNYPSSYINNTTIPISMPPMNINSNSYMNRSNTSTYYNNYNKYEDNYKTRDEKDRRDSNQKQVPLNNYNNPILKESATEEKYKLRFRSRSRSNSYDRKRYNRDNYDYRRYRDRRESSERK